jgi:hypothetical protein
MRTLHCDQFVCISWFFAAAYPLDVRGASAGGKGETRSYCLSWRYDAAESSVAWCGDAGCFVPVSNMCAHTRINKLELKRILFIYLIKPACCHSPEAPLQEQPLFLMLLVVMVALLLLYPEPYMFLPWHSISLEPCFFYAGFPKLCIFPDTPVFLAAIYAQDSISCV